MPLVDSACSVQVHAHSPPVRYVERLLHLRPEAARSGALTLSYIKGGRTRRGSWLRLSGQL